MKALYICDVKEEWDIMQKIFGANFPKVELVCAITGASALDFLSFEGPFGFVLIEAALKSDDPSKLGSDILDIGGLRPLLFLGNETMINDRVDSGLFDEHEENGIIHKPIDIEKFKKAVNGALAWAKEEEFEQGIEELDPSDILPMRIKNFYLFNSIPYDVYLELTETKFAKVISAGKPYTQSELAKLKNRKIKFLFLKKDEYLSFLDDSVKKLSTALQKKSLKPEHYLALQLKAALTIQQYIKTVGVTDDIIKLCDHVIDSFLLVSKKFDSFRDLLKIFPFENADFADHSILTAYMCELIGKNMGWKGIMARKKLGLASLIQDCYLTNDELMKVRHIDDKQFKEFSSEDQASYLKHPQEAAILARNFQGYPDTDFIVLEHHELPDGKGFPQGINHSKLTHISSVFIISTHFATQMIVHGLSGATAREAFVNIKLEFDFGNFKDVIKALEKGLKS